MFYKIGVLKNFTKFTGKHLWQSLLFNKSTGSILQLYEKVMSQKNVTGVFVWIFKNTFFTEHHWWLLFKLFDIVLLYLFIVFNSCNINVLPYRNQSTDFISKSIDWFLYDQTLIWNALTGNCLLVYCPWVL